ncbi:hypothetical protein V1284_006168 [Nitrobacteraceae bacterium AZCC 2299]
MVRSPLTFTLPPFWIVSVSFPYPLTDIDPAVHTEPEPVTRPPAWDPRAEPMMAFPLVSLAPDASTSVPP